MRRVVSVWLPLLATDRLERKCDAWRDSPLVTATTGAQRHVAAVNRAARRAGLRPGMTVADAQAVAPELRLVPADPAAERELLDHLADRCVAYTPWTAVDGWAESGEGAGLWLDISGCAHLFVRDPSRRSREGGNPVGALDPRLVRHAFTSFRGDDEKEIPGEKELLADLLKHLARLGFAARAAVADTPGAAWAWARFGDGARPVLAPGRQQDALAGLPVTALRLVPATVAGLVRLGLKRIGDLYAVPSAALAGRFGRAVGLRLDQALGRQDEPLSPRQPPVEHQVHLAFAEPVARSDDLAAATRRLLERLAQRLEGQRLGVRRLDLVAFRVDASAQRLAIGTSRPSRDPRHLMRLLAEPLAELDAGFGIDMLLLSAVETGPLEAAQASLAPATRGGTADDVARLVDALGNRLGFDRLACLAPRQSHLPERAVRRISMGAGSPADAGWPALRRPLRLFFRPEAVEAMAPVPDAPPLLFRWRRQTHRIRRAEGPERLSAEWWRVQRPDRDYYCVEDEAGHRFWLYREGFFGEGDGPRWFLHGVFP